MHSVKKRNPPKKQPIWAKSMSPFPEIRVCLLFVFWHKEAHECRACFAANLDVLHCQAFSQHHVNRHSATHKHHNNGSFYKNTCTEGGFCDPFARKGQQKISIKTLRVLYKCIDHPSITLFSPSCTKKSTFWQLSSCKAAKVLSVLFVLSQPAVAPQTPKPVLAPREEDMGMTNCQIYSICLMWACSYIL